jgi:GNAT superfamily N-acetyltransferase
MPPTTVHLVNEFSAALHYGPGPHPDGTPQSVHGGGAPKRPAAPRSTARAKADAADMAWLESVLVGASPKEMPGVIKGVTRFLNEKYPGATLADLRQMYTYSDPESGLRAEIDFAQVIGTNGSKTWVSGLSFLGNVRDVAGSGEVVGSFTRKLDDRGNVTHDKFVIQERVRNQGFGSRFYRNSEEVYRRIGVKEVRLQANLAVGGYAWARMGFDFAPIPNGEPGKTYYLRSYSNAARVLWNEETHGSAPFPEVQHAWEIAALTTPSGRRVGKEALLGSNWSGIKRLTPGSPGVQVGDLYYATKTKKGVF